jgi:hypothetical protein
MLLGGSSDRTGIDAEARRLQALGYWELAQSSGQEDPVQLSPLYILRYRYPDGWAVTVGGEESKEEEQFYFAEGRCVGSISGAFRAANHPRRRSDGSYLMNRQGFIETEDGALIMVDYQG